ncbi:MAG: T9SS type A sorting domain-containing protein [Prevotella sp.]|uniref:T9SS type A sorting domain-containing protein n=1 Tax=Prevotella sp. TaxID=59823 RepID=UPI002A2C3F0B|nr:T9SS type A sorting domain-containing protein [Prevotella sp.]MDD7317269.1 T9SS type A sorting domain-containing protein [Prevotellaceae bacterium]MDY4019873.1 T9SS type A sorting domain-containing protein [Prevotella sp.]
MKKKIYFASIACMLSLTAVCAQQKPFAPKKIAGTDLRAREAARAPEEKLVVEEHFDKFTAGTEAEPDGTNIAGNSSNGYKIADGMMSSEGWTGNHVYQAGQTCALRKYDYYGYPYYGHISTPETELYGKATITLRARRVPGSTAGSVTISLCDNTSGVEDSKTVELTDEWQNISFTTEKGTFNNRNIFQISAEKGEILVDDIKVTRVRNKIGKPLVNPAENMGLTSFKASWKPVNGAQEYLLNVFYKDMPANVVPAGTILEGFDGINLKPDGNIDTANPNYPAGWTIDVSSNGTVDVLTGEGNKNSGKLALNMDAAGDVIISPVTPAPVKKISFWVKPSTMEVPSDYNLSLLGVYVKHEDGKWEHIANLPNNWMEEGGGMYSFGLDEIGDYVTQVKIDMVQKTNCTFAIDDFTLDYETQPVPYYTLENFSITETSKVVEGIDPEKDYFYSVRAKDGELISEMSDLVWVDGIVGIKPGVHQASDVADNAFTAHWEELPHAGNYIVNLYEEITTAADGEKVMLVYEDFDKIKGGTIDNPEKPMYYTPQLSLAKEGKADTDWTALYPNWADGMIGGMPMTEWGTNMGLLASPKLLIADGGDLEVEFTGVTTEAEDELYVLIMDTPFATQAVMGYNVPFETPKTKMEKTVVLRAADLNQYLQKGKAYHIAFSSKNGKQFFIDKVKVTQKYDAKGTVVVAPRKLVYPEHQGYRFENLKTAGTYLYDVQAYRMKNYNYYTSEISDRMRVVCTGTSSIGGTDAETTGVMTKEGGICIDAAAGVRVEVYDMMGRAVYSATLNNGSHDIALSRGIYVVKVNNEAVKVAVR